MSSTNTIVLEATNVQKSFMSGKERLEVLRGVSVQIRTNEILSISGASGSGKSTLLHILGALDAPTAGEVVLDAVSFTKLTPAALAEFRNRTIGFVFQFHHLLPEFTALENVSMPAMIQGVGQREAGQQAEELLGLVGLADRLHHKPTELSGGEQQRVAVARALVNRPKLVLGDEPTGNLDDRTSKQLQELLWSLNEKLGMSFVIVTHDDELAGLAHRKMRLAGGVLHES
jgi:lipoprotein-releasing system ATP-binding protein